MALLSRQSTGAILQRVKVLAKIYFSLVKMKQRKTKSHPSSFELIIFHLKLMSFLKWGQVILFEQSDTSAWMERILKLHFFEIKQKLDSVFPPNVAVHHLLLTEELPENITILTHHIPNVALYFICLQGSTCIFEYVFRTLEGKVRTSEKVSDTYCDAQSIHKGKATLLSSVLSRIALPRGGLDHMSHECGNHQRLIACKQ